MALSMRERGRLGGLATLRRYGVEHFRTIGKAGFRALTRPGGSRRLALQKLAALGKLTPRRPFPKPSDNTATFTEAFDLIEAGRLDDALDLPDW
jgi:hypothetical protein